MRKIYVDFMGKKNYFFIASGILIVIAIAAIAVRGLHFGIEFQGGTVATLPPKAGVTAEDVRQALHTAKMPDAANASIQDVRGGGFIIRTVETSAGVAESSFNTVAKELGIPAEQANVQTIGPGWGKTVTNRSILALVVSLLAILLYVSVRFEYKMSVTAVIALLHDAIITIGIYALVGREITPNTLAALLTILGYSLYDTIVVFHRIRENTQRVVKQTFAQMANDSINQVLVRWINTSLTSTIPVLVLLIFGGETLRDFAFALVVGLLSGAYSSVGIASPLYAMWKEREPKYAALAAKQARAAK